MIILFVQNDVLRQSLVFLLKRLEEEYEIVITHSLKDIQCDETTVVITDQDIPSKMPDAGLIIDLREMRSPVTPASVLSRVSRAFDQDSDYRLIEELRFGPYVFKPHEFSLQDSDNKAIILTEKERDILLHIDRNSPVLRDDLLNAVWGYGNNIETHTVETHIYRLRQKIEKDPTKPELLITTDDGYCLSS